MAGMPNLNPGGLFASPQNVSFAQQIAQSLGVGGASDPRLAIAQDKLKKAEEDKALADVEFTSVKREMDEVFATTAANDTQKMAKVQKVNIAQGKLNGLVLQVAEAKSEVAKVETELNQRAMIAFASQLSQQQKPKEAPKSTKFNIPELENKSQYLHWVYQVEGQLEKVGLLSGANKAMQKLKTDPIADVAFLAALQPQQHKDATEAGAEIKSQLKGDALQICADQKLQNVVSLLGFLATNWGETDAIDQTLGICDLYKTDWKTGKETLCQFLAGKVGLAIRLNKLIPATLRDAHLCAAVLSLLPQSFDGKASELRSSLPDPVPEGYFRSIEAKLLDYQKGRKKQDKDEKSGNTLYTRADVEALLARSQNNNWHNNINNNRQKQKLKKVRKPEEKKATKCEVCKQWTTNHTTKTCNFRKGGPWDDGKKDENDKGKKGGGKKARKN